MGSLSKWGGAAALYLAGSIAVQNYFFLIVLDYPHKTKAQRVEFLVARIDLVFLFDVLLPIAFGIALVVLVTALHNKMAPKSPALVSVAGAMGLIWGGSVIAGGLVANAGMTQAFSAYIMNASQGSLFWAQTEAVAHGLGNGQITGGVMTVLFGLAGLQTPGLSRVLGGFGILAGLIGVASAIGWLIVDFERYFTIALGLWFIGQAWMLFRAPQLG